MIVYDNLWVQMKKKKVSQYRLNQQGISHSTLTRLKRNQSVSVDTIDRLCEILECRVEDVMEYVRK